MISSVTVLAMELVRNSRSAVLALVMTLTLHRECVVLVPKFAWLMCSAWMALVSTPLVT